MLPPLSIGLIVSGFLIAFAGAYSRGYVRSRLRESSISLKTWVTVGDELRYAEKYLKLATNKHFPKWPAILAVAGMPVAFVLMVLGIMIGTE